MPMYRGLFGNATLRAVKGTPLLEVIGPQFFRSIA